MAYTSRTRGDHPGRIAARGWRYGQGETGIPSVHAALLAQVSCFVRQSLWRRSGIAKRTTLSCSLLLVALTCTIAFGSSDQISETPTEAVRSTLTEVFRILEDEKLKDPAKLIPRRHMLEEVIASHFDISV